MIKPTIGRQVWFWRAGADLAGQPEAATVTYVHSDSMVNLQVIDHNGNAFGVTSVSLRQPEDPPWEATPFAEWMPYQKGQAAKTEQLERKLTPAPAETVEQQIQRVGATAGPRITPADIEANIVHEYYFTAEDGVRGSQIDAKGPTQGLVEPLGLLTFCVLVLRNGYTVHGHSGVASRENFNAEVGQRVARENAVRQIWPLMGYALRDRLAGG